MATKGQTRRGRKPSPLMRKGWIPDQHGAWGMGLFPLLAGIVISEKSWLLPLLAIAWIAGFLLFNVAEKWLKSKLKPRFRRPVLCYAAVAGVFGLILCWVQPHILWWAWLYLPLIAIWAWHAWHRSERALLSRWCTIIASCLLVPLSSNLSHRQAWFAGGTVAEAWLFAGLLGCYFALSVPYVKTMIRERNSDHWLVGSVSLHVLVLALMCWLYFGPGLISILHLLVWAMAAIRSAVMPLAQRRRAKPFPPRVTGLSELILSLLVLVTLPWGLAL